MAESLYWGLYTPSAQMIEDILAIDQLALTTRDELFRLDVLRIRSQLHRDLGNVAARFAPKIDERIRDVLESERVRPPTDKDRHLKDNIHSQPYSPGGFGFGAIGIASVEELDKTTNPQGGSDRPYWRVIEEGSDLWQPEMVGRTLFGSFLGPGGDISAPSQDRFRQDSSFIFGAGDKDESSGKGVIERSIDGQHFLDQGKDEMFAAYAEAMVSVTARWAVRLQEATARSAERLIPKRL